VKRKTSRRVAENAKVKNARGDCRGGNAKEPIMESYLLKFN